MTAQYHEGLIYEGENTSMASCPDIPENHPRITINEEEAFATTACRRRYQGLWEIKDERFYLLALIGRLQLQRGEPVFADWFSGIIIIPKGKLINYVYEQEIGISIEKGIVVSTQAIDNRGEIEKIEKIEDKPDLQKLKERRRMYKILKIFLDS